MNALRIAAALAALATASPAVTQTPVSLPRFNSVELQGGGRVIVRNGPQQRVTLLRGNLETTRLRVQRDGDLEIDACVRTCNDYDLLVEIVSPDLNGLAVEGGGEIRAEGRFPSRGVLALAISGGGEIDATAIESGSVAAAVHGGGTILARARNSLMAAVNGGGEIRYRGDPSVTSAINGGGSIRPIGR